MKRNKNSGIIICSVFILAAAGALGLFRKFEYRIFDLLLAAQKAPAESADILLVEADNISLENIGPWPWKRDVYANMLLRMKELGARTAVFDIEFLSPSNFPECDDVFARSIQFFGNTFLTINAANLDIPYSKEELDYVQSRFLMHADGDTDALVLGNRKTLYEAQKDSLWGFGRTDWSSAETKNEFAAGLSPAMHEFISRAAGAGFTNSVIDTDGTRRRIELLKYQDEYQKSAVQLAFCPLLAELKPQKIIRTKNTLILKNASRGGKTEDIHIPLDSYGRMIINWSHKKYKDSFRHESILFLDTLEKSEQNIVHALRLIHENLCGMQNQIPVRAFAESSSNLLSRYQDISDYKAYLLSLCEGYGNNSEPLNGGISGALYEDYFSLRADFFESLKAWTQSGDADTIQEVLFENRDALGEAQYVQSAASLGELFEVLSHDVSLYTGLLDEKSAVYKDAFCIIGNTATSSSDLGTTPFERAYPNLGTHANVYSTIRSGGFITPVHPLWGILAAALLVLLQELFAQKKKPFMQNALGIGAVMISALIPVLLMRWFGMYVPAFTPVLIALAGFLEITVLRFSDSEKEKRFLQTTFGAYVAPAVVEQIVHHPELASLGGKSENLTALFSDVKTFSGFTEVINNEYGEEKGAEKLVEILNEYLGDLSDAIMEQGGTIDKYVGDEIVSFFGAPVPRENNAFDACAAAVRMLQAEKRFNERNRDRLPVNPRTGEPFYLHSRIGLNSGMMVVGNMGTEKKLNYTVMGNNVNLASRLEGANKVYGSWIIASESTWKKADSGAYKGKLVARKFDNVRVVNVKKPVGIYNILGLKEELSSEQIEAARLFNIGMELYLNGSDTPEAGKDIAELAEAASYFEKAAALYPPDASSAVFAERCTGFIQNGVPALWDGVYTMKSK